ncbi:SCO1664 family protein [Streptomyces sp. CMB-StM0423]|uniref:SCO1664 family protein n=1 Tax=Streptomyces sp. CMB-StM0423 TaxID=2059884 RepID=UPI000C7149ED|nr:SCO1664 family protein [Streptomyces sp. CMB-StM0423]AUH43895.1 phosphatidylinositol kinase [Streptomyces sp. CMB-StM0423]
MSAPERIPPGGVSPPALASDEARALLTGGELTVAGRIRGASNAVLFCTVAHAGRTAECVYKPVAGERPLWDFPDGTLAQREVAAYEVSEATGWGLVPPTVLRDGPFGEGMCQLWIPAADEKDGEAQDGEAQGGTDGQGGREDTAEAAPGGAGLLALVEADEPGPGWKAVGYTETGEGRPALLVHADDVRLRRLAVLDAVINNGDRKGGHLLPAAGGRLYAIDHGVTFHTDDKLRTLLWGWAGEPLPAEAVTVLHRLAAGLAPEGPLAARLAPLITAAEVAALRARTAALLASGRHPEPSGEWPAIPWPPV